MKKKAKKANNKNSDFGVEDAKDFLDFIINGPILKHRFERHLYPSPVKLFENDKVKDKNSDDCFDYRAKPDFKNSDLLITDYLQKNEELPNWWPLWGDIRTFCTMKEYSFQ